MRKYDYSTPIKALPKKVQNDIYSYMKEGWDMYEAGTGEESPDRITKTDLINNCCLCHIEEQYPVESLLEELNK